MNGVLWICHVDKGSPQVSRCRHRPANRNRQ
jgi:hypothetical protein